MSIANLFQPNNNTIYAKEIIGELNGIQGQVITELNSPGQVLTIVSTDPKVVAFQDVPEGIPDTLGFPDGYVLKIIDNTTNTVSWEPDSVGGPVVPFILTGDSPTAFQVRDTGLNPSIIVDSTLQTVQLPGITRVEGTDSVNKFGVYTNADSINPLLSVSTQNGNQGVLIQGQNDDNKFTVKDNTGVSVLNIDTVNGGFTQFKSSVNTDSRFNIDLTYNRVSLVTSNDSNCIIQARNDYAGFNTIQFRALQDGTTSNIDASDVLNINANKINHTSGSTSIIGPNNKDKFIITDVLGEIVLKVDTLDGKGIVTVGGNPIDDEKKFSVLKSDDTHVLSVDTLNNKIDFRAGQLETGKIVFLDTPETIFPGVQSSVNMKLSNDADDIGNSEFVGYIAQNGPTKMFNVVNNTNSVLFFRADVAGIQSDAQELSVQTVNPSGRFRLDAPAEIKLVSGDGGINKLIINENGTDNGVLFAGNDMSVEAGNKIDLTATSVNVTGVNSENKFVIKNELDESIVLVNTNTDSVNILGTNSNYKFKIEDFNENYVLVVDTINKKTIIPGTASLEITDLPFTNLQAANKLYVDNKFSDPRSLSNITSYYNNIPSGTPPSVASPMVQVVWTQPVWTSAVFVNAGLNFTAIIPGEVQYIGLTKRWFNITFSVCAETNNADQEVQFVMLNGSNVVQPSTLGCFYTSTTDKSGGTSYSFQRELMYLDIVKFAFRTPRATNNVTFTGYKIQITEC